MPRMSPVSVFLASVSLIILFSLQPVQTAYAAVITVTNTDDSGPGSLRDAITTANANAGADIIEFRIPGTGAHTITPLTALPTITGQLTITGETEEGWVAATATTAAVLRIQLNGSTAGGIGLRSSSPDFVVRGLAINRFATGISSNQNFTKIVGNHIGTSLNGLVALGQTGNGIELRSATQGVIIGGTLPAERNVISGNAGNGIDMTSVNNALIYGNYIGTNATGLAPLQNGGNGIELSGGASNAIGADLPGARNIIAGNFGNGIAVLGNAFENVIQGNYIGVRRDGTAAVAPGTGGRNNDSGIQVRGVGFNTTTIGGTTPGARNIISGNINGIDNSIGRAFIYGNYIGLDPTGTFAIPNTEDGIHNLHTEARVGSAEAGAGNVISGNGGDGIQGSFANDILIQGNLIGLNAAGTAAIGNGGWGINVPSGTIGGTNPGEGNRIIGNALGGIFSSTSTINAVVTRNSIYNNGGLGLDASPVGVKPLTSQNVTNYPILTAAAVVGSDLSVSGTLNSRAQISGITIDFYANTVCDPSGHGEGEVYLGSTSVNTDGAGNTSFTNVLVNNPGTRLFITAVALQPFQDRRSSEFSTCFALPGSTPTGTINGTVTLQGRGTPPNALHAVPLSVIVTPSLGGSPVFDQTVTTTTAGGFTVPNVPTGSYTVSVKNPQALSCEKTNVIVAAGANALTMGTLRTGDANNDDRINIGDFTLLAATFGLASDASGYNANADFNGDGVVNISDFTLLSATFGQSGGGECLT